MNEIVDETMLSTLYKRCRASKTGKIIKDEKAIEVMNDLISKYEYSVNYDKTFPWFIIPIRNYQFDVMLKNSINNIGALVINLGCGLDFRFQRMNDVEGIRKFFDVDFENIVNLKRKFINNDKIDERYLLIDSDINDYDRWMDVVKKNIAEIKIKKIIFVAEGVICYFKREEIVSLFETICKNFTSNEYETIFIFDTSTRKVINKYNNSKSFRKLKKRMIFSNESQKEIEELGNIEYLESWNYWQYNGFFKIPFFYAFGFLFIRIFRKLCFCFKDHFKLSRINVIRFRNI